MTRTTARRTKRLALEPLEDRTVPASVRATFVNGILFVHGTPGDDSISVVKTADDIEVYSNSLLTSIFDATANKNRSEIRPSSLVKQIKMFAYAGDDHLRVSQGVYDGDPSEIAIPLRIYGGADDDLIEGGAANDTLDGGAGNDIVYGYHGSDSLLGGTGRDTLYGERGNDYINGGSDNDHARGGFDPNDWVPANWTSGNNTVYGGAGNDRLYGGEKNDSLYGGSNNDTLFGGSGLDMLDGGSGNDDLYGMDDADTIYAKVGEDFVNAGAGNDTVRLTFNWTTFTRSKGKQTLVEPTSSSGSDTIHVRLELGTFFGNLANPVIAKAKYLSKQFQPLLKLFKKKVPVLSLIDGRTYEQLIFDLYPQYRSNYERFRDAIEAINSLPTTISNRAIIDFGSFRLSQSGVTNLSGDPFDGAPLGRFVDRLKDAGVNLSFLTDPTQAVRLALGRNQSLFSYTVPTLSVGFTISQEFDFPSGWPLLTYVIELSASFNFYAGGTFGCDLTGLRNGRPFDGFYVQSIYSKVVATVGVDAGASLGAGPFELGEVGIRGELSGTVRFDLKGPNGSSKIYFKDLKIAKIKQKTEPLRYRISAFAEYRRYALFGEWNEKTRLLTKGMITV